MVVQEDYTSITSMNGGIEAAPSSVPPETPGAIQQGDSTGAGTKKAKKVRSACERCRQRRIKVSDLFQIETIG